MGESRWPSMVARISTGLTVDGEEVAQGRDQVLAVVAEDAAHHPNRDPAAALRETAREAESDHRATARGVEAATRDRGLALEDVTAGADQGPEDVTRRK